MNKLQIQNNMKFIEKHIDFTLVSKLYKNGIVGTTRDKKIIYLDLITHSVQVITKLDIKSMYLGLYILSTDNDIIYYNTYSEILQIKNGSIEVIDLTNLLKPTNHVKPPPEKKLVTSRRRKRGRANAKPRQPRAKSSAILSYKNGLIIYRGNKVFLLHEKKITLLTHLKDIKS